ncbi:MAG: hypothetical protein Q4F99_01815 [bacterium]|nr:hypothetical protein [bacterium]
MTKPEKKAPVAGVSSRKSVKVETSTEPRKTPKIIKPRYPVITPTANKNVKRSTTPKKAERFDAATLENFKVKLLQKREDLKEQLKVMREEALHRNEDDNPEEDASTFSRSTDLHRAEEINKQLRAIDDALRAIQDGTYGVCSVCGGLIPRYRLMAPHFEFRCLEFKKKYEADVELDKRNQCL